MLSSALLIFATSEAGFQLGRRRGLPDGRDPSSLIQATAFTVLALLLGFSFSMALGRYDARRATLMREANAIATTYLRAQLLDSASKTAVNQDLRAYVEERIAFARADAQPQARAIADSASRELQQDLWKVAVAAAQRDTRSTILPLFVIAVNDTIAVSAEERAVLTNHIPDVVIVWLLLIGLISSVMMGYGFGREGKRAVGFKLVFAVMLALAFGLVLDLDRPQRGIIRINLAPMLTVQQMIEKS